MVCYFQDPKGAGMATTTGAMKPCSVPDKMAKDSNRPVYFLVTKAWGKPSATQKCFRLWDGGNDEFLVHGTAFCDTVAQVAQVADIMIKTLPYFTRDLGLGFRSIWA